VPRASHNKNAARTGVKGVSHCLTSVGVAAWHPVDTSCTGRARPLPMMVVGSISTGRVLAQVADTVDQ
jgi:hypothetical protein